MPDPKKNEQNAIIVLSLIAIIFFAGGIITFLLTKYDDASIAQSSIAALEAIISLFLNLSTETMGVVVTYIIFKRMFGIAQQLSGEENVIAPSPIINTSTDKVEEWRSQLKDVLTILVEDKKINENDLNLFHRFKLDDGTRLITTQELVVFQKTIQDARRSDN